jgi:cytochrome c2
MKKASVPWGSATLRTYVANPQKTIPGIKMPYGGLHDPAKLDDLLAFLETLK